MVMAATTRKANTAAGLGNGQQAWMDTVVKVAKV
jgi:hypothetical protein